MGCSGSREFVVDEYLPGHNAASVEFYKSLYLTPGELKYLEKAFSYMDIDGSSNIRMDEFMSYFSIEDNKFYRSVFGIFGDEDKKHISFIEFVLIMWNFLTLSRENISSFAFMLLATTKTYLTPGDIIKLFEMIHPKEVLNSPTVRAIIEELKQSHNEKTYDEIAFANWTRSRTSLLGPIINLQLMLRGAIIGESFWVELQKRRATKPEFEKISYIMELKEKVKKIQYLQRKHIASRGRREQENAKITKKEKEDAARADRLKKQNIVTAGARGVRKTLIEMSRGKGKKKSEKNMTDTTDDAALDEAQTGNIERMRTPTILLRHANLARQEKRAKKRKEIEENNDQPPRSKKKPGRFTLANLKKQAQRKMKVTPMEASAE